MNTNLRTSVTVVERCMMVMRTMMVVVMVVLVLVMEIMFAMIIRMMMKLMMMRWRSMNNKIVIGAGQSAPFDLAPAPPRRRVANLCLRLTFLKLCM